MPLDLTTSGWLAALVDQELARYDVAAARARLPSELTLAPAGSDLEPGARVLVARSLRHRRLGAGAADGDEHFLETVRGHVGLVLDLSLLAGDPFHRQRRRAIVAACLAAATGEPDLALDADPAHPDLASSLSVERAFEVAARALRLRFRPPGDPLHGLPLYPGTLAVLRRHLARVASGALRTGDLDVEALARHRAFAQRELVLLVEAVAGQQWVAGLPPAPDGPAVRARQLLRLGLPRAEAREARRAMTAPRPPAALGAGAPERVRLFLLEQLLLAQLRAGLDPAAAGAYVGAFATGAGLDALAVATARVEAAAQHDDHLAWFEAVQGDSGQDWEAVAAEWEATADLVVERVTGVVTENLEALVTELRETGELGQLLARAAGGARLSTEEKRKVKAQLIDLAKAVPALAIFAAPGGMLLLPLLAKLLPFNMLPSSWDRSARALAAAPSAPVGPRVLEPGPEAPDPAAAQEPGQDDGPR
ncbi:MAG: hypothetical protein IPO09_13045 [Anaeromyxobacter sp.]|nr:hypothetical protein [Anaeromyxobacter sp.]MBL0275113.1 hypothetical protein [Anaeromyxobacter sp.]